MAGIGDVVRRMDYQKRARNALGVRTGGNSTKLQECSTFVKSANQHQAGKLHSAVRKVEADKKLFQDVHSKQLSTVKRFHNTVNTKLTNFSDVSLSGALVPVSLDLNENTHRPPGDEMLSGRRGSVNFPTSTSTVTSNQKRRHSIQADSSKSGRSFRKLRDAFAPTSKARISPEPVSKAGLKSPNEHPLVLLVSEANGSSGERSS